MKYLLMAVFAVAASCGLCDGPRPVRIVAFGDSITEGVIGIRPEQNWLRLLQTRLGDRAVLFNAGVGGNSAREAMARFERDVLAKAPDVVLLEFGGNNHDPNKPERRVGDDEFLRHLEAFRAGLPKGCRPVAVTFPPIKDDWHAYGRHPSFPNGLDAAMEPQRELLRGFARRHGWPIVDLHRLMKPEADSLLLRDGVHLNPRGQRVFADAVERTLRAEGLLGGAPSLTVLTWNTCHYGWKDPITPRQAEMEEAMFASILDSGADVALIQETYGAFERFKRGLPGWHAALLGGCNSVYSRYPIVATYDTYRDSANDNYGDLTGPFNFSVVELDVEGRRVRVCPVALNWQPYCVKMPEGLSAEELPDWERQPQENRGTPRPQAIADILASIRPMIAEADDIPLVLAGDFNSQSHLDWTPATAGLAGHAGRGAVAWQVSRRMAEAGFADTYRLLHPDPAADYGVSFGWRNVGDPASGIALRLDYIYAKGKSLKPVAAETVNSVFGQPFAYKGRKHPLFPSDHGFVVTRFELGEAARKPAPRDSRALLPEVSGADIWGHRPAHPAVVNPALGQDAANVISLRGEWEFQTRGDFGRNQPWHGFKWMLDPKPWPRRIAVPGCWEAQGVGQPGQSECWDVIGDNNAKPIRHKYMGVGCYRKTVDVPAGWRGKRVWLKVGGAKSVGWFYVNARPVASVDNFCGTYKYDVTDLVVPGQKATVVAQVRNDVPSRKGLFSAMHRWGGLYRDVELEATPETFVDDAWVRGNFDRGEAEAHVEVAGRVGQGTRLRFTVEGQSAEVAAKAGENVVTLPLRGFRPWSPERPNLHTGVVELVEGGAVVHARRERFGIRKLEVRGREFYLNNRPFFFRGFGDDHVYPLTGLTPADRETHRRHLSVARKAGFNAVRLHTHTEVPEYYDAADELGILIQPELPYYNDQPTEGQTFDPARDVTELWRHFRRHPSFGVYSMGNEGSYGDALDREMHQYVKRMDPDRLKINQDCHVLWINAPDRSDSYGGPVSIWPRGSFNPDRPFINHEYMNLGAKLDSRLEPRFSGVWQPPVTRAARAEWLARFGLGLDWGDRLQDASHALQGVYQKRGIECARSDPYSDGYHFWTIVDVVVANLGTYSAQGMFSPFWEAKRCGLGPEDIALFNSPSCVLLDTDPADRIFTCGQEFKADALFAHYGDAPLKAAELKWAVTVGGKAAAAGSVAVGDIGLGAARRIASLKIKAPQVSRPTKARIELAVGSVANFWDCWLFPRRERRDGRHIAVAAPYRDALAKRYASLAPADRAAEAKVVIAPFGSKVAVEALRRGQRVVTLGNMGGKPNVSLGWWWMGSQVGTALLDHPAFGELPHEGHLSPLLFRVLKPGRKLPFAGLSAKDMIAVGEGGDACYLYLAQAKAGKGRLLMAFGLDVLADTPEGATLLDGLVAYAGSDGFNPTSEVEMVPHDPGNGVARVVKSGETCVEGLPFGEANIAVARGLAGMNELVWETAPVPAGAGGTVDFTFYGGQGYLQQPPTGFELFVNGTKAIDIPAVTLESKTWRGADGCALKYVRDPKTMEFGWYTLTVPRTKLTLGKPATVRVVAKVAGTRRWFAVCAE